MARRRPLEPTESAAALYGFKLRQYRDEHDWTQNALADRVDCSIDLISKIERAERTATAKMSARFDDVFAAGTYFRELQPLAAREIFPDWFRPFPKYEAAATVIRIFELTLITGLLQTEEYMRELIAADQSPDKVDGMVAARLDRQAILARETPPHLILVMDEAAIRRRIGGANTMKTQIAHLAQMTRRPNITVQVVPAETGAYLGLSGSFTILTTDDDPDAVHVSGAGIGPLIEETGKVEEYRLRFDLLRASALSGGASAKLIETAMEKQ
jgi:transcriptional regulator with XRE-family HTH domain